DPVFRSVAEQAQRIVLDTDYTSLTSMVHLARWVRESKAHCHIADMAWTRLATWQELCARFFDEPRLRALASKVTRVTLRQTADPAGALGSEGVLLLSWMATRLGWRSARVAGALRMRRPDGGHVVFQLSAVKRPDSVAPAALAGLT